MTAAPGRPGPPVVRCFPRADRAFQRAVERLAAEQPLDAADPRSAADFERRLQARYPGAAVRIQDPLATFGGETLLWYVYRRDGPLATAASSGDQAGANAAPAEGAAAAAGDAGAQSPSPDPRAGPGARPVYSAAAAASMTGVPIGVLVGWDSEGLVRPSLTGEGQQLYSRNDLEDLVYLKRETSAGRTPEQLRDGLASRRGRRDDGTPDREASRRLLVLLAERDPYAAEYAEYFLRTEGYDVEVAYDTGEALLAASSLGPDLAVVELLISGGMGTELCARLRDGGTSRIVAISSLHDEDAALRAGADAFLAKPLDPLQFVSTIKDLLGDSALLQQGGAR